MTPLADGNYHPRKCLLLRTSYSFHTYLPFRNDTNDPLVAELFLSFVFTSKGEEGGGGGQGEGGGGGQGEGRGKSYRMTF